MKIKNAVVAGGIVALAAGISLSAVGCSSKMNNEVTRPSTGADPKDAELKALREEVEAMKLELSTSKLSTEEERARRGAVEEIADENQRRLDESLKKISEIQKVSQGHANLALRLQGELEESKKQLGTTQTELGCTQVELAGTQKCLQDIESDLSIIASQKAEVDSLLMQVREEVRDLQDSLQKSSDANVAAARDIDRLKKELEVRSDYLISAEKIRTLAFGPRVLVEAKMTDSMKYKMKAGFNVREIRGAYIAYDETSYGKIRTRILNIGGLNLASGAPVHEALFQEMVEILEGKPVAVLKALARAYEIEEYLTVSNERPDWMSLGRYRTVTEAEAAFSRLNVIAMLDREEGWAGVNEEAVVRYYDTILGQSRSDLKINTN